MILQKLWIYLSLGCLFFGHIFTAFVIRVLYLVWPTLAKKLLLKIGEQSTMTQNPKFRLEDWGHSFTTLTSLKTVFNHIWLSLGQEAFVGWDAPDSQVVTLEGNTSTILKHLNGNRPLVLSFGSSHATDGWAFGNNVEIKRHQTLGDRLVAAQTLVDLEPGCPVVVDDMSDVTACKYGSLPERLYVLQAGKVVYKGSKGPWGYYPSEVRTFLEKMN
ncbi:unnamed protein product [Arctogadus glacialis]